MTPLSIWGEAAHWRNTSGKKVSVTLVQPRIFLASKIVAHASPPIAKILKSIIAQVSPPQIFNKITPISLVRGMRCSYSCCHNQAAVMGSSPVTYGTNAQSSQIGTSWWYLLIEAKAAISRIVQVPHTKAGENHGPVTTLVISGNKKHFLLRQATNR